jgi:hypothetical protein
MAAGGARQGAVEADARRLFLSRFVLEHRLQEQASLSLEKRRGEDDAIDLLLSDAPVSLDAATTILQR